MRVQDIKHISGGNYCNDKDFEEMVKELEAGQIISIGISCIGHERARREEMAYVNKLKEKFGERLEILESNTLLGKVYKLRG